jgi:hypothetical protein
MSASKPITLLSFICNTTGTPAYRTEMHMDMRRAFQRFAVDNGTAQGACFEIERAAYDLRTSSSDAFALVPANGALYADADARMRAAPRILFNELVNEIVAMVLNPSAFVDLNDELDPNRKPDVVIKGFGPISRNADSGGLLVSDNIGTKAAPKPHLLLDYVYYFFHFKEARAAILKDMSGVERAADAIAQSSGAIPAEVIQTLQKLGSMMDSTSSTSVTEAAVRPLAQILCNHLASEYEGRGWRKCW